MKTFVLCLLVASALAAPASKPRLLRGRNKIVGGVDAIPGEFPYQASFQDLSFGFPFHFCGGSIYNQHWVITAGHCVVGEDMVNPDYLQVVAGEYDLSADDGTEQTIILSRIILHDQYNADTIENDIALLQLSSPLAINAYVAPIALATEKEMTGLATVSGWGTTTEGGSSPDILQKVDMPLLSDADCRRDYGESDISDSMICAGEEGVDACQGDSGGPMVCGQTSGGTSILCGVVSWGYGCGRPNYPGVYTEVAYFVEWVVANAV